ncbi:MAG TPA: hemolysin family protein [Gaiellaceae bacterium]|nr:hemolysin family protein [Gaiellaceae bacterium]
MILGIVAAFVLVAANGFFVATEFALARIRPTQVRELVEAGRPGSKSLRHAVDHLDAYLAACQLGITMASIGLGFVSKPAFEALIEPVIDPLTGAGESLAYVLSFAFAFGVVTFLHVVFGELAPKSLAIARNVSTALVVAPLMRGFYISTKPLVDIFNWMGNQVLKPFGVPPASEVGHVPHTEDELRELLRQSVREGLLNLEESEYAERVFSFGDLHARQVMVPRAEITYVTTDRSIADAARIATESGHTRLPLCRANEDLDAAVGLVNAKDLLQAILDGGAADLASLQRPLRRVSESLLIDELLTLLRTSRAHIALVVDEHGTTVGLVSMEDVLEEIVGDIEDEFDRAQDDLIVRENGQVRVSGLAPLRLVEEELDLELGDAPEATLGGHLVEQLGRIPDAGEVVEIDGHEIEILGVDETRIVELRFL